MKPTLPAALGRYRPLEVLGAGAMGVVYRAHDPSIDRIVAIKVMRADLLDPAARAEYIERFSGEARAAARCAHPAVVAIFDLSEDRDSPFIVMEFVAGRTLAALLPPPAQRAAVAPGLARLLLPVLDGLGTAHRLGIVHRDIKPANIIISPDGQPKITDFGIARLDLHGLTATGAMVGTPRYMAPEQALGRPVDHRADLFSVSAILYEIILGRPAFGAATLAETLLRLTGPDPADLRPLAGTRLHSVLARGLAKTPEARFGSAAEFIAALRPALPEVSAVDEATIISRAPPQPMRPAPGNATRQPEPSRGPAGTGMGFGTRPGPATGTATGTGSGVFDSQFLNRLGADLASHVGPIALTLLKRAASTAATESDLVLTCAGSLPAGRERDAFVRRHMVAGETSRAARTSQGVGTSRTAAPKYEPAPETLAIAAETLAFHVGPIAKVLVRKAADQSRDAVDFVDRLCGLLDDPKAAPVLRRKLGLDG